MSMIFSRRWGIGLSAAAGTAVVAAFILLAPRGQATPASVLARGAKAVENLGTIHLRGQLRASPADNFGSIAPNREFCSIELWKVFGGYGKWRVEKAGRVVVMDGESTRMFIKPTKTAVKLGPSRSAFDTEWLHKISNLGTTIANELENARARGWKMSLEEQKGADGHACAIVTVEASSGLPENDYLKNRFIDAADTRRVYRFDAQSERLEAVQVFVATKAGEVLLFEVSQIDYNEPIDSSIFKIELPADVNWFKEMEVLPDNAKYAAMTVEQAARAFFEACSKSDWDEAAKFWRSGFSAEMKKYLGGLELVSIGEPFGLQAYPGWFVPYEIRLKDGGAKKFNLALKKDENTGRWFVDGGI